MKNIEDVIFKWKPVIDVFKIEEKTYRKIGVIC